MSGEPIRLENPSDILDPKYINKTLIVKAKIIYISANFVVPLAGPDFSFHDGDPQLLKLLGTYGSVSMKRLKQIIKKLEGDVIIDQYAIISIVTIEQPNRHFGDEIYPFLYTMPVYVFQKSLPVIRVNDVYELIGTPISHPGNGMLVFLVTKIRREAGTE